MPKSKKQLIATFLSHFMPSVLIEPPLTRYNGLEVTAARKAILEFLDGWSARLYGTVVEVGAGDHPYLKGRLKDKCHYIATDCIAGKDIDIIADARNLIDKLGRNCCDFVICTDVLEHTEEPVLVVQQIHGILKQTGTLLLTTPFNYKLHTNEKVKDYWRFSEDGLRKLLSNFEISEINPHGQIHFPYCYTVVAKKL